MCTQARCATRSGHHEALTHRHDIGKITNNCSVRARLSRGGSAAAAATRSCQKATHPQIAQSGAGKAAAQWRHLTRLRPVARRRRRKLTAALIADWMSTFDKRPESESSSTADASPPPPSPRSICTQHSEVGTRIRRGARACAGSRAPSRAALGRAPTADPRGERYRRGRRAQLLLLRRSASLVACRAARARSGQARGGPSLRAQIPGFNVISGYYPGFASSTVMADPPPPSQPAFTGPGRRGDCSPWGLPHCMCSSTAGPRRLYPHHSRGAA